VLPRRPDLAAQQRSPTAKSERGFWRRNDRISKQLFGRNGSKTADDADNTDENLGRRALKNPARELNPIALSDMA
jgi:hypothetical protein